MDAGEPQRDHNREIAVLANRNRPRWCVSSAVPIAHEPPRGIRSGEMAEDEKIMPSAACWFVRNLCMSTHQGSDSRSRAVGFGQSGE